MRRPNLPIITLSSLVATLLTPLLTSAHSITRNALNTLSTVQNATIHTHSGRVTALSSFDLSFVTFHDLHVKFVLEPNHDILAHDASITYLGPNGLAIRTDAIDRSDHKVYRGNSWVRSSNDDWHRAGWARITLAEDGQYPLFEGGFSIGHVDHHIQHADNFAQVRHDRDPVVEREHDGHPPMVVWRDSDVLPTMVGQETNDLNNDLRRSLADDRPSCGADHLHFNTDPDHPIYHDYAKRSANPQGSMDWGQLFGKRQIDGTTTGNGAGGNLVNTIGTSYGCPTTRKVALVGIATDCTYTNKFNSTESARSNIINMVNTASAIYESTFNISLGLQNLTISDPRCPGSPATSTEWNQECSSAVDIQDRLNYFSAWRGAHPDNNAYWTLLSTCQTGAAVGLAWLGQACVNQAIQHNTTSTGDGTVKSQKAGGETVAGANVVVRAPGTNEWQIMAHETGHIFGAVHDCTSSTCSQTNDVNSQQCCPLSAGTCDADQRYIMNPSAVNGVNRFSPCSIGNICSAMGRNSVKSACLVDNQGVTTISGQQCGNGIVEAGEECDCGGTEGCGDNKCCNPTTCKFTNNAVCDDSNENCCRDCQFASNSTVCRPSTSSCDPQETCPGNVGTCPQDIFTPDLQSCGDGLQCASGQCTSRDQQCKDVMSGYAPTSGITACPNAECQISCSSPEWGSNVCYGPQQNFLDGTPCSNGGSCSNGICQGSSAAGWLKSNKGIVIGICAAVGGLILLSLLGCITRRCCRGNRRPKTGAHTGPPPMQQVPGTWYPPRPPLTYSGQRTFGTPGGYPTNGAPWDIPPVPPAQSYYGPGPRYA